MQFKFLHALSNMFFCWLDKIPQTYEQSFQLLEKHLAKVSDLDVKNLLQAKHLATDIYTTNRSMFSFFHDAWVDNMLASEHEHDGINEILGFKHKDEHGERVLRLAKRAEQALAYMAARVPIPELTPNEQLLVAQGKTRLIKPSFMHTRFEDAHDRRETIEFLLNGPGTGRERHEAWLEKSEGTWQSRIGQETIYAKTEYLKALTNRMDARTLAKAKTMYIEHMQESGGDERYIATALRSVERKAQLLIDMVQQQGR